VYGRTDLGIKGMHKFYETHKCGKLCRMLRRRWVSTKRVTSGDAAPRHIEAAAANDSEDDEA
jgi:hypothetical protein